MMKMRSTMLTRAPAAALLPRLPPSQTLMARTMPRLLSTQKQVATDFDANHNWRQQNHIWTEEEVRERMMTHNMKHEPQSLADNLLQKVVRASYHTFNFATGYDH